MDVPAFVSKFLSYRAGAGVPHSFALHRTADGCTHAFFLGATQTSAAQDLFVASAPPPPLQSVADEGLPWSPLVQLPDDFDPVRACSFFLTLIKLLATGCLPPSIAHGSKSCQVCIST